MKYFGNTIGAIADPAYIKMRDQNIGFDGLDKKLKFSREWHTTRKIMGTAFSTMPFIDLCKVELWLDEETITECLKSYTPKQLTKLRKAMETGGFEYAKYFNVSHDKVIDMLSVLAYKRFGSGVTNPSDPIIWLLHETAFYVMCHSNPTYHTNRWYYKEVFNVFNSFVDDLVDNGLYVSRTKQVIETFAPKLKDAIDTLFLGEYIEYINASEYEFNNMNTADILKELKGYWYHAYDHEYSINEIAKELDVKKSTLRGWANNNAKRKPSKTNLDKIKFFLYVRRTDRESVDA